MRAKKKFGAAPGFSLIEVMVSLGLLVAVVVGATTLFKSYIGYTGDYVTLGEEEDMRRFIRARLDCKVTTKNEKDVCKNGGLIHGYDANSNKLIENTTTGRKLGNSIVKLHCTEDEFSYNITATIRRPNGTADESLMAIPLTCAKATGVCIREPGWGDIQTFPVGVAPSSKVLRELVQARASDCGMPVPPDRCGLRRAWGAPQRPARVGYKGNVARDVIDYATLNQVCKTLGYNTYVGSTCLDSNSRCGNWSCSDDCYSYFAGGQWHGLSPRNKCYYQTWLPNITCKDPIE